MKRIFRTFYSTQKYLTLFFTGYSHLEDEVKWKPSCRNTEATWFKPWRHCCLATTQCTRSVCHRPRHHSRWNRHFRLWCHRAYSIRLPADMPFSNSSTRSDFWQLHTLAPAIYPQSFNRKTIRMIRMAMGIGAAVAVSRKNDINVINNIVCDANKSHGDIRLKIEDRTSSLRRVRIYPPPSFSLFLSMKYIYIYKLMRLTEWVAVHWLNLYSNCE